MRNNQVDSVDRKPGVEYLQHKDRLFAFRVFDSLDDVQRKVVATGFQRLGKQDHRSPDGQRFPVPVEYLDPEEPRRTGRVPDAGITGGEAALGYGQIENRAVLLQDAPGFTVIAGARGHTALEVDG